MRKGEILGLQWENVDLEKKVLWVRKNLCRVENNDEEDGRKTKLILLEPKTKKSIREIPLSEEAVKVLKIHKRKQNEQKMLYRDIYQDNGVVFAKADGSFEDPREVLRRFHKILKKAGVRKCRFHDLRHTFASFMTRRFLTVCQKHRRTEDWIIVKHYLVLQAMQIWMSKSPILGKEVIVPDFLFRTQ